MLKQIQIFMDKEVHRVDKQGIVMPGFDLLRAFAQILFEELFVRRGMLQGFVFFHGQQDAVKIPAPIIIAY